MGAVKIFGRCIVSEATAEEILEYIDGQIAKEVQIAKRIDVTLASAEAYEAHALAHLVEMNEQVAADFKTPLGKLLAEPVIALARLRVETAAAGVKMTREYRASHAASLERMRRLRDQHVTRPAESSETPS